MSQLDPPIIYVLVNFSMIVDLSKFFKIWDFVNFNETTQPKLIVSGLVPRALSLELPNSHKACLDYVCVQS